MDGYHILATTLKNIALCKYNELEYSGVAMRVRLTIRSGDCGGIVQRFDASSGAGYFFYLCQNHTYGLLANLSDRVRVNLVAPTALLTSLPVTNTLAMVALNETLTLYLNGKQLSVVHNARYAQGLIGMVAWNKEQATEAVYQDLQVWKVVETIPFRR